MILFWICMIIAWIPFRLFAPFCVKRACKIDKKKNYIIICNHQSNFDVVLIDMATRSRVRFLAKKELFSSPWKRFWLKNVFGGIAIDRSQGLNLSQTKTVFSVLKKGQNLGIFPEGTRGDNFDKNKEVKGGACLFALKSGTPILPCYIVKKHRFFRKNTVLIGKPFELKLENGQNFKDAMQSGEIRLKEEILALKNAYDEYVMQKKVLKQSKKLNKGKKN